jgi:Ca2+/Na+ antiporter
MLLLMYWAYRNIAHSGSSTAGLGFLIIPPLLYLLCAATFLVDRSAVLAWRLAHRGDASS